MEATLQAVKRGDRGKNEARRLRAAGRLPAVVYGPPSGGKVEALAIAVEPRALSRILHSESGANTLITLRIDGEAETKVLVKEYQVDPVSHALLHADFYRVAMDKTITVTVPIVLRGEAKGVKQQGGLLDFVQRQVEIECLPGDIPEHIEIDVTELLIGQGVRVRDLSGAGRWKAVSEPDTMLVHVVAPKVEEPAAGEAAAAAGPAAAEPEVIKKGKTEKEEDKG
ncbi:MAG TPA: 50S ribosomal protein L25 [Vicinamibacterales bacterium]|nr:50S ribosomal protein L25 [Vicinamibacterales bacterium]